MADCMEFPNTAEGFIEQYKFTDTKQEYTNGSELIPVFRVKQMMEHYFATDNHVGGKWIPVTERLPRPFVSVLAYVPSEAPLPMVHESYIADHDAWVCVLTAERYNPGEVTHWMPMPEPPKGE